MIEIWTHVVVYVCLANGRDVDIAWVEEKGAWQLVVQGRAGESVHAYAYEYDAAAAFFGQEGRPSKLIFVAHTYQEHRSIHPSLCVTN